LQLNFGWAVLAAAVADADLDVRVRPYHARAHRGYSSRTLCPFGTVVVEPPPRRGAFLLGSGVL